MTNLINAIKIPNNSIIEDFKEHLDLDLNQRILFTAPFGAGKSTFINDFQEKHKDEYRFIRLYPVNYAVSANEDVFELIKFDILYELIEKFPKNLGFEKEDFPLKLRSYMFLRYQMDKKALVTGLLDVGGEIGKPLSSLVKVLWNTYDEFKAYNDKVKVDEFKQIEDFFKEVTETAGTPKEMNSLSEIIRGLVDQLKGEILTNHENIKEGSQKRKYKTVLVIDDLDRLDPDHIFRLLNIFSAHTHFGTEENKFGFDKVVFVCDIENIRKIYAHKYGKGVDFDGYMDKFCSINYFEFDNFRYLNKKIVEIIEASKFIDKAQLELIKKAPVIYSLSAILKILLKNKVINLRSVLKNNMFSLTTDGVAKIKDDIILKKNDIPLFAAFEIVSQMLGGWENFERALVILKNNTDNKGYVAHNQRFIEKYSIASTDYGHEIDFLKYEIFKVFVADNLNNTQQTSNNDLILTLHDFNLELIYSLDSKDLERLKIIKIKEVRSLVNIEDKVNYDLLLLDTFKKLQEYGLIPITK